MSIRLPPATFYPKHHVWEEGYSVVCSILTTSFLHSFEWRTRDVHKVGGKRVEVPWLNLSKGWNNMCSCVVLFWLVKMPERF